MAQRTPRLAQTTGFKRAALSARDADEGQLMGQHPINTAPLHDVSRPFYLAGATVTPMAVVMIMLAIQPPTLVAAV